MNSDKKRYFAMNSTGSITGRLAFACCHELREVIFLGDRPQIESDAFIHTKVKL